MNWNGLKIYVNEPVRTRAQLERVARSIGISPHVKGSQLLHNINRRIDARIRSEGRDADSGFSPLGARSRSGSTRTTSRSRLSTVFNNVPVQLAVRQADPATDEPFIDRLLGAYSLPTTGDFFAKRARLEAELHAHPTDPAPAAVDTIMADWVAAHPPPANIPRRNNYMNNRGIIGGLVAIAALLIYFFVIAPEQGWWPNDDSRRDRLVTAIEDDDLNKVDNILKDDDFDDDDIKAIEDALAELLAMAKANNVDEDEVNEELLEAIRDLDDDFDEDDLLEAIEDVVTKVVKTNGAGSSADNQRINALETKLNEILAKLTSQPPSAPAGNPPTTGGQPATGSPEAAHFARLETLDPAFRSGGWQNWLSAAGVKCETVRDARQPEEETSPSGKISVAGLQVEAKSCHVPWPNVVTTDVPSRVVSKDSNAVEYKPDPNNGSVLYTNVTVTGPVTIWADAQNWGQFTSKLGFVGATPPDNSGGLPADGCFSLAELDSRYGIDRNAQGASNGLLMDAGAVAGAVLRLNANQISELEKLGWTIQGTNPAVKSAWSPAACRPLS